MLGAGRTISGGLGSDCVVFFVFRLASPWLPRNNRGLADMLTVLPSENPVSLLQENSSGAFNFHSVRLPINELLRIHSDSLFERPSSRVS